MTQEEKAKAYDKVREKIKVRFGTNVAEEIFSEFEETEDERIRKIVINLLKQSTYENCVYEGVKMKDIYAWLEKQGKHTIACSEEQMKVLNEVLNFAANHESPYWNYYIFETLNGLIKQLKKLKV